MGAAIVDQVVTDAPTWSFTPADHTVLWYSSGNGYTAGLGWKSVLSSNSSIGWSAGSSANWSYVYGTLWLAP